jgi:hypothetical protein
MRCLQRYRALVLIEGIRSREGGVEITNGEERPHNNLDFLLIGNRLDQRTRLTSIHHWTPWRQSSVWGLISASPLLRTAHEPVPGYLGDMRFGHKQFSAAQLCSFTKALRA